MPFSREEIELEFNNLSVFDLHELRSSTGWIIRNPDAANRRHVAAWRSRQTPERLRELRHAEYMRNRTKRIASAQAYRARTA